MRRRTRWIAAAGLAAAVVGGGAAAPAAGGGDRDQELTGTTRDRAVQAALAATGGGTVTETGDDGAAYGVEVRLPTAAGSRSTSTRASRSSARNPTSP
jgi:hypothetical protein